MMTVVLHLGQEVNAWLLRGVRPLVAADSGVLARTFQSEAAGHRRASLSWSIMLTVMPLGFLPT
jgi:hypothetical protein